MTIGEVKSKCKVEDISDKKNQKPPEKIDIALLEEDDDFEEFPAHACGESRANEEAMVWEDNWDDDIVDDEFTHHLRSEFQKQGKAFVVPEISANLD
uniref:26S proteasome complex subunit SEM1 n=1 Tax=Schistosoma japonicum TaxID=6182 RepID=C1LF72_SCHJA|nr:26 proteasome complex subunit DSS1 [Schistosoma japonicum]